MLYKYKSRTFNVIALFTLFFVVFALRIYAEDIDNDIITSKGDIVAENNIQPQDNTLTQQNTTSDTNINTTPNTNANVNKGSESNGNANADTNTNADVNTNANTDATFDGFLNKIFQTQDRVAAQVDDMFGVNQSLSKEPSQFVLQIKNIMIFITSNILSFIGTLALPWLVIELLIDVLCVNFEIVNIFFTEVVPVQLFGNIVPRITGVNHSRKADKPVETFDESVNVNGILIRHALINMSVFITLLILLTTGIYQKIVISLSSMLVAGITILFENPYTMLIICVLILISIFLPTSSKNKNTKESGKGN